MLIDINAYIILFLLHKYLQNYLVGITRISLTSF